MAAGDSVFTLNRNTRLRGGNQPPCQKYPLCVHADQPPCEQHGAHEVVA